MRVINFVLVTLLILSSSIISLISAHADKLPEPKSEVVKLKPHIRYTAINNTAQEVNQLQQWQNKFVDVHFVQNKEIEKLPRVISNRDGKLISLQNDDLYVSNLDRIDYKKPLAIYRLGQIIKSADNKQEYGNALNYIGDVKLKKVNVQKGLSLVKVTDLSREIIPGDKVLVKNDINNIKIKKNTCSDLNKLKGTIVGIINGVKSTEIGQSVLISLGKKQGIEAGNVLSVVEQLKIKRAIQVNEENNYDKKDVNNDKLLSLPEDQVGKVLIYNVYEDLSLGLVIESSKPVMLYQMVKNG